MPWEYNFLPFLPLPTLMPCSPTDQSIFMYNQLGSDPWSVSGCMTSLPLKGLYFMGSSGMLVSQLHIREGSLPLSSLQKIYYNQQGIFESYLGPRLSSSRQSVPIPFELQPYPYRVHNVAPPLATASVAGETACKALSKYASALWTD